MSEYTHINVLVQDSAVYDSNVGDDLVFERVEVLPNCSIVKYTFEHNKFIDVWVCEDGMLHDDECDEPTHRYTFDDHTEYHILDDLLNALPLAPDA